jgi:precorrin-3B C17-methyltransferase
VAAPGIVFVIGLGPGRRDCMTGQALDALSRSDVVVGYEGYLTGIADLIAGKERLAYPLGEELERARRAVQLAGQGRNVAVVSSGDPGVYGMASLVLEAAENLEAAMEVVVVPGVSAVNAAASLLGAPLGHDFAVISLSDLLTPWEAIERRLAAAAGGDFVIALLNPRSRQRDWQLRRAQEILLRFRAAATPAGIVQNAYRPGQRVERTTLGELAQADVDMFTTVIVGNSSTRRFQESLVTPRRYPVHAPAIAEPTTPVLPEDILKESFRLIGQEAGDHSFSAEGWAVVRRMIHASGDVELARRVEFRNNAVEEGIRALDKGTPLVVDGAMTAAGINKARLRALNVVWHCFIDDPEVDREALAKQTTRSRCAMEKALARYPEAIYAIGNAPTALLAVCDAVRKRVAHPRLLLAMPVGFVGVLESKDQARALEVPLVLVEGRRGGSALAAAAVNALLELTLQRRQP